ncbi:MAG: hypothetical protein ACKVW3_13070 [Phycisphaerales bacterium]
MLVVTVQVGDEIVIDTPSGQMRIVVGGPSWRRRKLGIDAPCSFRVNSPRPEQRPPAPRASIQEKKL